MSFCTQTQKCILYYLVLYLYLSTSLTTVLGYQLSLQTLFCDYCPKVWVIFVTQIDHFCLPNHFFFQVGIFGIVNFCPEYPRDKKIQNPRGKKPKTRGQHLERGTYARNHLIHKNRVINVIIKSNQTQGQKLAKPSLHKPRDKNYQNLGAHACHIPIPIPIPTPTPIPIRIYLHPYA